LLRPCHKLAYRLLVQAGPEGVAAGSIASALKLAPNMLTFHFDRLREAGLVTVRREGRSMIYAARFDTMNALLGYLTENCCQGRADEYAPAPCKTPASSMAGRFLRRPTSGLPQLSSHVGDALRLYLEPQSVPACIGGHGTEPYEQNTQQSPNLGLSRSPQPLQL